MSHFTRAISVIPKVFIVAIVAILNIIHPFIHGLEGGGFDVILINLDIVLMHLDGYVSWHDDTHCDGHVEH